MESKLLGRIEFNTDDLNLEVEKILHFEDVKEEYSEYRFGLWKNYPLWNTSGDKYDTLFQEINSNIRVTEFGKELPYINSKIEEYFNIDFLQMVRVNRLQDGWLIPHRDYNELDDGFRRFKRIHIPINTIPDCLHSDEDEVFHMRLCEIWNLDVASIHAAFCPDFPRLNLVLDFLIEDLALESIFKDPNHINKSIKIETPAREPLTDTIMQSIHGLRHIINEHNYTEILSMLSKLHFKVDAGASEFLNWMKIITSGNKSLSSRTDAYIKFLTGERTLGERNLEVIKQ